MLEWQHKLCFLVCHHFISFCVVLILLEQPGLFCRSGMGHLELVHPLNSTFIMVITRVMKSMSLNNLNQITTEMHFEFNNS